MRSLSPRPAAVWLNRLLVSLTLLWFSGCQTMGLPASTTATPAASSGAGCEVKFGVITSLSGGFADRAVELVRGYDMARDDLNAAGGVIGCSLVLVTRDDASNAADGMAAFQELVEQERSPLVIGSFASAVTLPLVPLAGQYQTPLLAHNAANDLVTSLGSDWVFRTTGRLDNSVRALMDYTLTLRPEDEPSSLAVIYENTVFGQAFAQAVTYYAKEEGISLAAVEAFTPPSADFKPLLARVQNADPDFVLFSVDQLSDALLLMKQSREIDFSPQLFLSNAGAFTSAQFLNNAYADYFLVTLDWSASASWHAADGTTTQEFSDRFQTRYGVAPGDRSVNAYVNVMLAAQALELASQAEPLDWNNMIDVRTRLRDALRALDLPDTLFGPIKFDSTGQNYHPPLMAQVIQGRLVIVAPADDQTGQMVFPMPGWGERVIDEP
ncbi:MAG: ABC transporter substrate-binding protein [Anaerolineaceae bacterium]|nr:ABC transporter substrate-binding protein [Anaerolineaceae bacterium]MCB9100733.1 ABC transporter substrate-binding protein [Anaerolineales bacterium]